MTMRRRFGVGSGVGLAGLLTSVAFLLAIPAPAWAGLCYFCGGNAATVGDGIVFDELAFDGPPPKPEGPFITGVKSAAGVPVTLRVEGDKLFAFTKGGTHQSVSIGGIVISLAMRDGRAYDVRLDSPNDLISFWVEPQERFETYIFTVTKVSQRTHPRPVPKDPDQPHVDDDRVANPDVKDDLCKGTFPEPVVNPSPGQMRAALVFTGDHYTRGHRVTKQRAGLFNLACFGTASAKMHLLRHTSAGSTVKMTTTFEQRTTMLRAITADYCGDGHSWTGDGTPLWWTDRKQAFPLTIQPDFKGSGASFSRDIEAIWGTNGKLLCLNDPRRTPDVGSVNEATCQAPSVPRDMVTRGGVACQGARRLPRCSDLHWEDRGDPSPWSEPPLNPRSTGGGKTLPAAYVVTVNRKKAADYCNKRLPDGKKVGGPISWP